MGADKLKEDAVVDTEQHVTNEKKGDVAQEDAKGEVEADKKKEEATDVKEGDK